MISKRLLITVVFLLWATLLVFTLVSRAINVPYERDEISWYFHTEFFDELFLQKKLFSSLWDGYESFDHPPVSKYIYGTYLYLRNRDYMQERNRLEEKYGRWKMYYTIKSDSDIPSTEFAPPLFDLRKVSIVFGLLVLVEIVILCYILSHSMWFSFLLGTTLTFNSLFIETTAVITSDNHLLFFSLLTIIFYLGSMRSRQQWWLVAAAFSTGFATGAKLTGIFLFLAIILNELFRFAYRATSVKDSVKRIALYVALSFGVWIIINPALYVSPFKNTWRYFSFRNFQSANIAYYIPQVALSTPFDRVQASICTLVIRSCGPHSADGSFSSINPLNMSLFILGILYCWQAIRRKKDQIIFLALLEYCIFVGYTVFLSNYGQRYFVLLQVILFVIETLAIQLFAQQVSHKIKPRPAKRDGVF